MRETLCLVRVLDSRISCRGCQSARNPASERSRVSRILAQAIVEITRIPNAPDHVQGVINLRGKIVPIVDMRGLLGFEPKEACATSRVIVVEAGGMMLGFLVDAVSEVVRLPQAAVDEPPTFSSGVASRYIDGVGKVDDRLLILLNLRAMFPPSEGSTGFAPG